MHFSSHDPIYESSQTDLSADDYAAIQRTLKEGSILDGRITVQLICLVSHAYIWYAFKSLLAPCSATQRLLHSDRHRDK